MVYLCNQYYNDYYKESKIYPGSIESKSGSALTDYFGFNVITRFSRFVIITGNLRLSGSGDFYFKVKVPNFNKLWAWNTCIQDIKNASSTVFLSTYHTCITIEQSISGNDSYFEIKGQSTVPEISMHGIWALGY